MKSLLILLKKGIGKFVEHKNSLVKNQIAAAQKKKIQKSRASNMSVLSQYSSQGASKSFKFRHSIAKDIEH